ARDAPAEDLVVGQQDEAKVAPDEAAACRRDREVERGRGAEALPRLEQARLDAAQHVLGAEGLAAVGESDDDALAGPHELRELRLRLREPAGGDRRPRRLEGMGLRAWERIELARARARRRLEAVLLPGPAPG